LDTVTFLFNVLKVVLGLGFVIFIHELGHFLLAKWNGVKVERFSIGFFSPIATYRRGVGVRIGTGSRPPGPDDPPTYGETEYVLAILPLGGYVKMLGETEDQADGQTKSADPRAFNNKSVGSRMAIITAGVIMNLILGFCCFAYVHTQPGMDIQPTVGGVIPGSPAELAGLRAGDEIVAVDGQRDIAYTQVVNKIRVSGAGEQVHLLVKRPGEANERPIDIEPKRDTGSPLPAIGLYPASSLSLANNLPFATLPGQDGEKAVKFGGFEGNDKVVAVGPAGGPLEPVANHADLLRKFDQFRAQPVVVEVDRVGTEPPTGKPAAPPKRVQVIIPPHRFVDFGFRISPGPIASVQPDSPAGRAGLKPGDRIVSVADQADYDPMRLPDLARDRAGTPLNLAIRRAGAAEGAPTEAVTITPDSTAPWTDMVAPITRVTPLAVPGLGLTLAIEPRIAAVAPGSPAAKGGLKAGDAIKSIVIVPEKTEKTTGKSLTFTSDDKRRTVAWPSAFEFLQDNPVKSVRLLINDGATPVDVKPEVVADRFSASRGLNFQYATKVVPPASAADAIKRGAEDTWENVAGIYKMFRSLAQRRVGGDAFGGIFVIAQVAYNSASVGLTPLVQFLGVLSINLAVLNFLPIPPLDGGQFLFLTAEKVRGKPLPDAALAAGTYAGIALVLVLIVVINVKDVVQLVQSYL